MTQTEDGQDDWYQPLVSWYENAKTTSKTKTKAWYESIRTSYYVPLKKWRHDVGIVAFAGWSSVFFTSLNILLCIVGMTILLTIYQVTGEPVEILNTSQSIWIGIFLVDLAYSCLGLAGLMQPDKRKRKPMIMIYVTVEGSGASYLAIFHHWYFIAFFPQVMCMYVYLFTHLRRND